MAQRLHSESLRSTAAPTSVTGASDRNARLFNWLADNWRDLQTERDWRWMRGQLDVAVTAGQQTYTGTGLGASRFRRWRKEDSQYTPVMYRSGNPNAYWVLEHWDLDSFRRHFIYRNLGQTTPIAWTFDEQNQLLVGPAPLDAYQLRIDYWKSPTELTADADEPDMPSEFHMLLVWDALIELATSDAAPEILAKAQRNHATLRDRLMLDQARLPHL